MRSCYNDCGRQGTKATTGKCLKRQKASGGMVKDLGTLALANIAETTRQLS